MLGAVSITRCRAFLSLVEYEPRRFVMFPVGMLSIHLLLLLLLLFLFQCCKVTKYIYWHTGLYMRRP